MVEQTLEECAQTLEALLGVDGVPHLVSSLRKGEVPILLIGKLNATGNKLARVTNRINEIILEEQRKELQGHG
jgi:hypothetical protein